MGFKWERIKLNGGSIRLNGGLSISMFDYQRNICIIHNTYIYRYIDKVRVKPVDHQKAKNFELAKLVFP